jgi:anti-sigma factor RsiW
MTEEGEDQACQDAIELLSTYLDGALPPSSHSLVEHHLADCAGCLAYLEQLRLCITVMGRLDPPAPDPSTRRDLIALLDRTR